MTTPEQRSICQFRNNTDSKATWHRWGTGKTRPVGVIRRIKRGKTRRSIGVGITQGNTGKQNNPQVPTPAQWNHSGRPALGRSASNSAGELLHESFKWRITKLTLIKVSFLQSRSAWCSYGNLARPRRAQKSPANQLLQFSFCTLVPSKTDSTRSSQLSFITKYIEILTPSQSHHTVN